MQPGNKHNAVKVTLAAMPDGAFSKVLGRRRLHTFANAMMVTEGGFARQVICSRDHCREVINFEK